MRHIFTKLFTLLTMAAMTMEVMASTVDDLVAIDHDWTFIAERYTANGTVGLTRNTLYADGRIFTPTDNTVATNKGNSYINGIARLNCLRLKSAQDRLAFKVSGPCTVTFYTNGDNSRGIYVSKTDNVTTDEAAYAKQPVSTTIWTVELDAAGVYYLTSYNGDFYFAGFEIKYAAAAWQKIAVDLRSGQLGTEGTNMQKYLAIDGEEYTYTDADPGSYNAILSASSYNGIDHGYVGLKATVPVVAGIYKISLGACKFANGTGYVKNSDESSVLNVVNAHGQTVNSFSQNTGNCYHQNTNNHVVCLWYTATEAETINILCDVYTPYFSIERVNNVPELKYLVIYQNNEEDVEGVSSLPKFDVLDEGDEIAVPINRKLYKEGYTWQGWNDGSVTHAPGTSFAPTAITTTLTTVFTANKYGLDESVDDLKVRWEFHQANGAPIIAWEGHSTPDLLVTQANLNGHTIDMPLYVTTSPGKFNNTANEHTCQVNGGTSFTFPSLSGITLETSSHYDPATSTLDGNTYNSYSNHIAMFSSTNESGTATFVNLDGGWYEYFEMTVPASGAALPLVKEITVDGVAMNGAVLAGLNYEDDHAATFSDNIYTSVPVVQVTYSNDEVETISASGSGSSRTYSFSKTISAVDYTFTFTVEGVHEYEAGVNYETVQLKFTSAGKDGDDDWSNGMYSIHGQRLDGNNNSVFKFSHLGNGVHTLSIPSYIAVKQIIIKDWGMNYDVATKTTIISVTSTGAATIYVPTQTEAYYNAPRDLIINLDGHVKGTPIVINMNLTTQAKGWFELKVEKQYSNYTREHPHMNLNTLCYPYTVYEYTGATFYNILETEVNGSNELTKLVLEEHVGALEAGKPYFYDPEGSELVCYYSGDAEEDPGTADGGLTGVFADNSTVPEGSYVTVNNQLYKCGTGVTMGEYRAYVTATSYSRAAVPGRRRLVIGGKNMPTDIDEIVNRKSSNRKFIKDGQLFIIRDGKTYNALGQLVD